MLDSRHQIFRDRAMNHYLQRRQKDVLPHLIAAPAFLFLWLLLALLLIATVLLLAGLIGPIGG
jgi:hypothetical protein